MYTLSNRSPRNGDWVVWVMIDRRSGHTTSGLSVWDDSLEANLLNKDYYVFWTDGKEPALRRIAAAVKGLETQITEHELSIHSTQKKIEEFNEQFNAIYAELVTGSPVAAGEDGDSSDG